MNNAVKSTGGFRYRGSKWRYRNQLIAQLPAANIFIDMFCGSGAVSIAAVESGKYNAVVANDRNNRMVRTLTTMRDKPKELRQFMLETPYARATFEHACTNLDHPNDIAAACNVLIAIHQSAISIPIEQAKNGWFSPGQNAGVGNRADKDAKSFQRVVDRLWDMRYSLLDISFENRDWKNYWKSLEGRRAEKSRGFLIFCDPPYSKTSHFYTEPFDHEEFIRTIQNTNLNVIVMEDGGTNLADLERAGWERTSHKAARNAAIHDDADNVYFSPGAWKLLYPDYHCNAATRPPALPTFPTIFDEGFSYAHPAI